MNSQKFDSLPHEHTNLGTGASKVRTKHDNPRGSIRELLSASLEAILKKFHISTSTVTTLLVLDLILHHKGLVAEGDGLGEGCRDSMVSSLALCHKTAVAVNNRDRRLLDLPFADVAEGFTADGGLLRCF
jgi:hypothetical protein